MPTVLESALATPVLRPVQHGRLGNLQSRLLNQNDAAALIRLRDEVLAGLDNPDMYVREDDENGFVRTHIGSGDKIAMVAPLGCSIRTDWWPTPCSDFPPRTIRTI